MQTFTATVRSQSHRLEGAHRPQKKQQGYTIVELSIAVAIAGVLLVSAIGLVRSVINTSRANDTATMLTRAVAKIEKSWATQPTYVGVSLASVAATDAFNGLIMTRDAAGLVTDVRSRFNQSIAVSQPAGIPGPTLNRGYVITLAGVPTTVCSDLVTAAANGGARGIVVGPESAVCTVIATGVPTAMTESSGVITKPADGVVVLDGSLNTPDMTKALGSTACGTDKPTVSMHFVGWK